MIIKMNNQFDVKNHERYNLVLQDLDIPFIDVELKKSKLWKILGDDRFLKMEDEAFNSDNPELVYLRYTRQNGIPFTVKLRKLNIMKRYDLDDIKENDPFVSIDGINKIKQANGVIDHYGVHFDSKGNIFHFLPDGVHSGSAEYDKELCSDEWKTIDINDGKPFFTLMSIDEINMFCKRWDEVMKYQFSGHDSKFFSYTLAYWLN